MPNRLVVVKYFAIQDLPDDGGDSVLDARASTEDLDLVCEEASQFQLFEDHLKGVLTLHNLLQLLPVVLSKFDVHHIHHLVQLVSLLCEPGFSR